MSFCGAYSNFGAGKTTPSDGPSTTTTLETTLRIAISVFTQGPPDWLQPGELKIPISMPRRLAVENAVWRTSFHSGENVLTGPLSFPPPPMSPMYGRSMPAFFIASRSFLTPSHETFPAIQYQ